MAEFAGLVLPTDSLRVQRLNRSNWNAERSQQDADFFTVGYMSRTADEFVELLARAQVASLVDVRFSAVSMYKPAFSKSNLARLLDKHDINYLHVPTLGVPRDIRGLAVGEHDRSAIWEWYDAHVVDRFARRNLHDFFNAAEHPVAFMCVELDPTSCHRHRLSRGLEAVGLRSFDL